MLFDDVMATAKDLEAGAELSTEGRLLREATEALDTLVSETISQAQAAPRVVALGLTPLLMACLLYTSRCV